MADPDGRPPPTVVDGGDRACGELLLVLARQIRGLPAGTRIRLVATDPAAVLDVPAFCHLTHHLYLGRGHQDDGRPRYDIETVVAPRPTDLRDPWRLRPGAEPTAAKRKDVRT